MFEFWSEGPRTWKWLVPGAAAIMLAPMVYQLWMMGTNTWQLLALAAGCVDGLFALAALTNYVWLLKSRSEDLFRDHAEALSATPIVLLARHMKQMHPDAVKVLNRFGVRTSWQVRLNMDNSARDWVLSDTNAHFGFIEYVLQRSGKALYPKRNFSDGSKRWDPDGLVEDREQYEDLEKWLFARMMVTRSFGEYRSAEFLPPWTPELVLDALGLTGEQELYRPNDDREVKQLPTESVKREVVEREAKTERREPELSEEEAEAVGGEMSKYAGMYVDGKVPR